MKKWNEKKINEMRKWKEIKKTFDIFSFYENKNENENENEKMKTKKWK